MHLHQQSKRRRYFSSSFSGVTSINVARSFVHSSSLMGLSEMMYLPSVCSSCQASRQRAGSRFFSQKMHAARSGGTCSWYGNLVTLPFLSQKILTAS